MDYELKVWFNRAELSDEQKEMLSHAMKKLLHAFNTQIERYELVKLEGEQLVLF